VADGLTKVLGELNKMDLAVAWSNILTATEGAAGMCENINSLGKSRDTPFKKQRASSVLYGWG